jgi:hypothetical protein
VHGSCRKIHGGDADALALVDHLLKKNFTDPMERPHQMFLTGDQIYADDVSMVLLPRLTEAAAALLGVDEQAPIGNQNFVVNQTNFPSGRRQTLMESSAKMTSSDADAHLLSFGEYCALYLFAWSNVIWAQLESVDTIMNSFSQTPPTNSLLTAEPKKKMRTDVEKQKKVTEDFRKTLPAARRVLANVPTFMICDDHEVTDDWYLTQSWRDQVLTSTLGATVVRNGILAYALFQAWGNDPVAFETGLRAELLTKATELFPTGNTGPNMTAANRIARLFGLDGNDPPIKWNYTVPGGPYQVVVLDTRTRRTYAGRYLPPGLLSFSALQEQLPAGPPSAGVEVLLLISPAPVLGLTVIEELAQPVGARVIDVIDVVKGKKFHGYAAIDVEAWAFDVAAFESFLARLQPYPRVVIFSGDPHLSSSATMDYWKQGVTQPTRLVQFVCSALNNQSPLPVRFHFTLSTGRFQELLGQAFVPAERLGWKNELGLLLYPMNHWRKRASLALGHRLAKT